MTLTSTDVRDRLGVILRQLHNQSQPVVITDQGKAEAVLLSIEQYLSMVDLLEDRADELDVQLGHRIHDEREAYAHGEGRDFEAFLSEADA
ncbi:MAG: type II toxin-antitoxin system Phd/YefM family antitoxin [Chloroflexi bacterium]|nr:type II toxin-antitoxin system Phd/YefM family antitoxin [Chloroflexota bacterium]